MSAEEQDNQEILEAELVFRTDIKGPPKWRKVPYFMGCGALVGLLFWYQFDGNLSWSHIIAYCGGFALIIGLFGLPMFRKKELKEIRVNEEGFKIYWAIGSKEYKWKELEAARFETYPIANLHTNVQTFKFRVAGKNTEIFIDSLGDTKIRMFSIVTNKFLSDYCVPLQSKQMWSFNHFLAVGGAVTFAASAIAIIIAYVLYYRTLGFIFGTAFLGSGVVVAFMTRKERISKYVLVISAVIVISLIAWIWTFHIDVGQVFRDWDKQERRLGRPPWPKTTQLDSNEHANAGDKK